MSSSFSYDRYDNRSRAGSRRGLLSFWIPVTVTVTLAAGGLAAWVFRARDEHETTSVESDDDEDLSYGGEDVDKTVPRPSSYGVSEGVQREGEDGTIAGRVQGILRRTPSPQQVFDGARKGVIAAGAAVGGIVGGALGSIREEEGGGAYEDHERWRREGGSSAGVGASRDAGEGKRRGESGGRKRTVAVVISAEEGDVRPLEEEESGWRSEHASLLSQIPPVNLNNTNLVILIYAPRHQAHASTSGANTNPKAPSSLGSSYTAIPTPGEELSSVDPMPITPALSAYSSGGSFYDVLYKQASRLVSSSEHIMPFSTPGGFTHMLKHLNPDVVYITESLSGKDGSNISGIKGWVGQTIVVVGGDAAGLVETEDELTGQDRKWWETSDLIGLGKGVEVVDAIRLGDDWVRRVSGKQ